MYWLHCALVCALGLDGVTTDEPIVTEEPGTQGAITQAPETVMTNGSGSASFTCRANGFIIWAINNERIEEEEQADRLAAMNIFVPPPGPFQSSVRVDPVTESLHMTSFQCLVVNPATLRVINASEVVQLFVIGTQVCSISVMCNQIPEILHGQ